MDSDSKAVMMGWEKPLMEAQAKAYGPATHTIVEAHPVVYERMLHTGWGKKNNVKIILGRWQDVVSQLGSYDGILFDTYGEYYKDLREFHQHLPKLLMVFVECGKTPVRLCLVEWENGTRG
ncbi:hypothetical protein V6N11_030214 [Hibiscus sabdariffa]|uniref:Uncharacterized protein n=1 Tax=Hibiscus sabdariffa TaxID=183260 RepID=A0ABR2PKB3_9ROSI